MTIYVSDIVDEVSSQLNDQGFIPFTRWTKGELIVYLNDSLIMVGNFRPDAFTSTTDIALVPGAQQTLPTGFSFLKSIDSNAANSNCPGSPVTEANLDILRSFFKKPCMPTGGAADYRVTAFSYDMKNPQIFYVSPPVPDDAAGLEVTATLVGAAPQYNSGNYPTPTPIAIDPKYKNALIEWMLYRAYQVDTESVSSRQTKLDSYAAFWKILGVEYKQESGYRSGWYLGQKGQGDATAGSRG